MNIKNLSVLNNIFFNVILSSVEIDIIKLHNLLIWIVMMILSTFLVILKSYIISEISKSNLHWLKKATIRGVHLYMLLV